MEIEAGKFKVNLISEIVNTRLNIESLINLLVQKKVITEEEFVALKKKFAEDFKKEYPNLFT